MKVSINCKLGQTRHPPSVSNRGIIQKWNSSIKLSGEAERPTKNSEQNANPSSGSINEIGCTSEGAGTGWDVLDGLRVLWPCSKECIITISALVLRN